MYLMGLKIVIMNGFVGCGFKCVLVGLKLAVVDFELVFVDSELKNGVDF